MAVSGTYNFNPPIGQLTLNAFSRCQIKRTEVLAEHMENAWLESNLLQADWSADGITWWTVELVTQALTQGVSTYTVPLNVVAEIPVFDVIVEELKAPLTVNVPMILFPSKALLPI